MFFLEFGDTQAILFWNFGLQDDLYFLRCHLVSIVGFVKIFNDLGVNDFKLDFTCQACLLIE